MRAEHLSESILAADDSELPQMLRQFEENSSQNDNSLNSSLSHSVHEISQDFGVDESTISDLSLKYL